MINDNRNPITASEYLVRAKRLKEADPALRGRPVAEIACLLRANIPAAAYEGRNHGH
jgi:siroheme synthase